MNSAELIEIQVLFEQALQAFDKVGNKIDDFANKAESASKQTEQASGKVDKLGGAFTSFGETLGNISSKLQTFGNKLLVLGASWTATISNPLKQAGQDAVDVFLTIERSWVSMAKVTGDSVGELKKQFGEYARTVSETYGVSQTLVIDSMNEFVKAGIESEEQLRFLEKAAAETSILFDTDLATATTLTRQLMQQWGWTIDDVGIGMSIINEIADDTATSELDLAQAFTVASPAAKAFGVEMDELGGYIAAMAARGYAAGESGTALRTIMQYMSQDSDRLSDAFESLGVEITESKLKSMDGGEKMELLAKAYADFKDDVGMSTESLKSWSQEVETSDGPLKNYNKRMNNVGNTLGTLVRKRQFPKLIGLLDEMSEGMDGSDGTASEYAKALDSVSKSSGDLLTIWDGKLKTVMDSAPMKWDIFKERINNAKQSLGEMVSEAMIPFLERATEMLEKIENMSPETQALIVKIGMIATAIGPVLLVFSTLINTIATSASVLAPVFTAIGGAISAIGTGPLALLAVVFMGIFGWIGKIMKVFREFLDRVDFEPIIEAWGKFTDGLKEGFNLIDESGAEKGWMDIISDGLATLAKKINEVDWEAVGDIAKDVGVVLGVIGKVIVIIIKFIGWLILLPVWLTALSVSIQEWAAKTKQTFIDWAVGVWNTFVQWHKDVWNSFIEWGRNIIDSVLGTFGDIWQGIIEWVAGIIQSVSQFGKDLYNQFSWIIDPIVKMFVEWFDLLWSIVKLVFLAILAFVKVVWTAISTVIITVLTAIRDFLEPIITAIVDFIVEKFNMAKEWLTKTWEAIKSNVKDTWNWIRDKVFKPIADWLARYVIRPVINLKNKVVDKFNELKDQAGKKFQEMKDKIQEKLNLLKTYLKNKIDSIFKPIKDKVGSSKKWGKDFLQNFIDGITAKMVKFKAKVNELADTLKDYLGFSVPEKGPLSDADIWMPDMIDLMSSTLEGAAPQLFDTVRQVATGMKHAFASDVLTAGIGTEGIASITPRLVGSEGLLSSFNDDIATPISAASPRQNVTQIHKHFEVRPGVMIASTSEQREFVRHIQKLEEIEDIRTSTTQ